jgi:hypothetical protein
MRWGRRLTVASRSRLLAPQVTSHESRPQVDENLAQPNFLKEIQIEDDRGGPDWCAAHFPETPAWDSRAQYTTL